MKAKYVTPVAEKLEFDYTQVVVASNGNRDMGVGRSNTDKGCDREPGHNEGWNHGHGCF